MESERKAGKCMGLYILLRDESFLSSDMELRPNTIDISLKGLVLCFRFHCRGQNLWCFTEFVVLTNVFILLHTRLQLSNVEQDKRIPDEMKYVKLHKSRLNQDELLFPTSESGDGRGTIYDKEGAHKIHKVTTKFVEAMQGFIVAREQWQKKQRPYNGIGSVGDQIKKVDGTRLQAAQG
ncbi:hypothetical protein OIU85_006824 [Salix viminalis]|uniref:Uncharacterized protein n=1 Tax=Salix viminalis TaxID=40686 RepID=A0A9Q0PM21_SALVM|nr:hypothetical protein OIU85_006824 [Salix viminalis]